MSPMRSYPHFGPAARIAPLLPRRARRFATSARTRASSSGRLRQSACISANTTMIASRCAGTMTGAIASRFSTELSFADARNATGSGPKRSWARTRGRSITTKTASVGPSTPIRLTSCSKKPRRWVCSLPRQKLLMDRNAEPTVARQRSVRLRRLKGGSSCARRGRLLYAITPRYAGSSSPEQLQPPTAFPRASQLPDADADMGTGPRSRGSSHCSPSAPAISSPTRHHGLCGKRAVFRPRHLAGRRRGGGSTSPTPGRPTPDVELQLEAACSISRAPCAPTHRSASRGGASNGAGTSFSILQTLNEALQGLAGSTGRLYRPSHALLSRNARFGRGGHAPRRQDRQHGPRHGGRSRGSRHAVDAPDRLPHEPGPEFAEQLFVQMILGDDRAVQATLRGRPPGLRLLVKVRLLSIA